MKEVLILTGACGVGKSTLAREWAKLKDGAIIDCDYFTEWIFQKDFPHWTDIEERLTARITARVAQEYLDYGLSVAIENVWTDEGIGIIKKLIQHADIKAIHLHCELSENMARDAVRIPENQMRDRVKVVKDELEAIDWPAEVHQLDTSKLTIWQTLAAIEKLDFH
jgi:shikimate kinase